MENCNMCKWVSITEEQQIDKKVDHRCLKHKVKLFHRSSNPRIFHSYIYPCVECNGKDFESK